MCGAGDPARSSPGDATTAAAFILLLRIHPVAAAHTPDLLTACLVGGEGSLDDDVIGDAQLWNGPKDHDKLLVPSELVITSRSSRRPVIRTGVHVKGMPCRVVVSERTRVTVRSRGHFVFHKAGQLLDRGEPPALAVTNAEL